MKQLFLPYELAKLVKEKGFSEDCVACYKHDSGNYKLSIEHVKQNSIGYTDYLAPLYTQIIDWLREKHYLHVTIGIDGVYEKGNDTESFFYQFTINEQWVNDKQLDWFDYKYGFKHIAVERKIKSYYEALNKGIEETLKLI